MSEMSVNTKGYIENIVKNAMREIDPEAYQRMVTERQAVIEYKNQTQNVGFTDPATRLLLEGILAEKEHQAKEVRHLLGL